jgi:hypothetical protein
MRRRMTRPGHGARAVTCPKRHVYRIPGLPPLPVIHLGGTLVVHTRALQRWIASLHRPQRNASSVSGILRFRDDELEFMAGA